MMSTAAPTSGKAPLDHVMLAMDVVDTLRHRGQLVQRELSQQGRDEALRQRLRKIYAAQGIEVSDEVIAEGVAALKEDRFVYQPPRNNLRVRLAKFYIARERWGKWVLGAVLAIVLIVLAYLFLVVWPRAALPGKLSAMHEEITALAAMEPAKTRANELYASAQAALRDQDPAQAKASLAALTALRDQLEQSYTLEIINRPGEQSGIWRTAQDSSVSNFYLIVEALDAGGQPVSVPITSEENGETAQVSEWGVRVDEHTFLEVGRDHRDDGIIQHKHFGSKHRGQLEPEYHFPTSGGNITQW